MSSLDELRTSRLQLWERMKEIGDRCEEERREMSQEEKNSWDEAESDIKNFDSRIAQQERLASMAQQNVAPLPIAGGPADTMQFQRATSLRSTKEYKAAMRDYYAHGGLDMLPANRELLNQELRALGTTAGQVGGYIIDAEQNAELETAMLAYGGMREVATIINTESGADLPFPTSDDTGNTGEIVSEGGTVSEQDVSFNVHVMKAFIFSSKRILVPYQLLQDASFDVGAWLNGRFAERIARIQNNLFTLGTGANQPSGIVPAATLGKSGATGQTTSVGWDDLIDLEHSVDPAYRARGRFMFSDATLAELRKLKDGEGRYLWQPGMPGATNPQPNTIDSYPYTINQDMSDMLASQRSILFGDLAKYHIRLVVSFTSLRLNELYANQLQVGFFGYSRADGALIDAGTHPVTYYQNSAT